MVYRGNHLYGKHPITIIARKLTADTERTIGGEIER